MIENICSDSAYNCLKYHQYPITNDIVRIICSILLNWLGLCKNLATEHNITQPFL